MPSVEGRGPSAELDFGPHCWASTIRRLPSPLFTELPRRGVLGNLVRWRCRPLRSVASCLEWKGLVRLGSGSKEATCVGGSHPTGFTRRRRTDHTAQARG